MASSVTTARSARTCSADYRGFGNRLILENTRLQAEVRAQLLEVREFEPAS